MARKLFKHINELRARVALGDMTAVEALNSLLNRPNWHGQMVRNPHQTSGYSGLESNAYEGRKTERGMHITAKTMKQVPCTRSVHDSIDAQIKRLTMLHERKERRRAAA